MRCGAVHVLTPSRIYAINLALMNATSCLHLFGLPGWLPSDGVAVRVARMGAEMNNPVSYRPRFAGWRVVGKRPVSGQEGTA